MITKNQINKTKADASVMQAHASLLLVRCIACFVALLPLGLVLWYVRETKGDGVVLGILACIGVIILFVLGAFIVDRFQERATNFNASVTMALSSGMSAAMAQQARTQGEMDRSSIRVLTNQALQNQRIDTSRQLADQRQSSSAFEFDDEIVDAEIREVF